MSVFWNTRTKSLSPYVPGEQPKDRTFIKLNTNENPYPPSPKVITAIEERLSMSAPDNAASGANAGSTAAPANSAKGEKLRLYPDPLCSEFREAVAKAYKVKPEQVFPGNGSDEVLGFAFGAFFEDEIFFPDITYSFYPVYANLWGVPYKTIPLAEDFSINTDDYIPNGNFAAPGGVILPNPNAPTGRALPAAELLRLADGLAKNNKVLIVDEAYAAFGAESLVPHTAAHPNLLTVHTLSKSASLAGLRAGFAIGSEALVEGLFRARDSFNSYTMDALALAGGAAALLDHAYYQTVNQKVIATRERTAAALEAMGFTVIPSKANFLFVSGVALSKTEIANGSNSLSPPPRSSPAGFRSPPGISGLDLFTALRDKGILARHFNKPRIADYLRVSIGTDEDMDRFLAACAEIIG